MSYGIEIRNQDGFVIIDNASYNFQVISTGTYASGTYVPVYNPLPTGQYMFIRPSIQGSSIWRDATTTRIFASVGDIDFIIIQSQKTLGVVTGYGLVAYDSSSTPLICFSDSVRFIRLLSTSNITLTTGNTTIPMPTSLPGKYKYIDITSLGTVYSDTSGVYKNYVNFNTDSTATVGTIFYANYNPYAYPITTPIQYNIIEC